MSLQNFSVPSGSQSGARKTGVIPKFLQVNTRCVSRVALWKKLLGSLERLAGVSISAACVGSRQAMLSSAIEPAFIRLLGHCVLIAALLVPAWERWLDRPVARFCGFTVLGLHVLELAVLSTRYGRMALATLCCSNLCFVMFCFVGPSLSVSSFGWKSWQLGQSFSCRRCTGVPRTACPVTVSIIERMCIHTRWKQPKNRAPDERRRLHLALAVFANGLLVFACTRLAN